MSREIIDKIVEMQFNNAEFERDVKESMSTLEKLKQSLDMSVVGQSIDKIQVKFSALDAFVKRTVEDLADSVYYSSKKMIKSLTVDNIGAGWSKFADKTAAVQTIMSATAQTWENSANQMARANKLMEEGLDEQLAKGIAQKYNQIADGTLSISAAAKELGMSSEDFEKASKSMEDVVYAGSQMEYVDEQLQKLNWFTDETSYKFLDMVNNIGKFTANNIPLEDAVNAMQGIATWAGISGANANEAGRAMYNLSQAMSVGAVKLMDWKSIENANMATAEFKQTAIETAVAMGTLTKNADGTFKTLKGNEVSVKNFNAALSDCWFSSEVLMKTLDKYGGFSVKLQEVSEQTGLTAAELLNYIDAFKEGTFESEKAIEKVHEALGDTEMTAEELTGFIETLSSAEYELGERAFRAAQQAKTFQDVVDYIKEAVSTGWSNTFQNIFGNFEEARDFWSQMAEELYGVFVEAGDERNALLSAWKEAGGRDDLVEAFWNIFHAVTGIINAIKGAFRDIFPKTTVDGLLKLTSRLKEFTKLLAVTDEETGELNERGEKIATTFRGIFAVLGLIKDVAVAVIKPVKNLFSGLGGGLLNTTERLGEMLYKFSETVKESGVLEVITERLGRVFSALNEFVGDTIQLFKGVSFWEGGGGIAGIFESMFDGLNNVINLFFNLVSSITGKDLSKVRDTITDTIRNIRDKVVGGLGPLSDIFGKLKTGLKDAYEYIKEVFNKFREIRTDGLQKVSDDTEKAVSPLVKICEGLKNVFSAVWTVLKKLSPLVSAVITKVVEFAGTVGKGIADAVSNADFTKLLDFINGGSLAAMGIGIAKFINGLKEGVTGKNGILGAIRSLKDILGGFPDMMDAWSKSKRAEILLTVAKAIGILALSLMLLAGVDSGALTQAIFAISALFAELMLSTKYLAGMDRKTLRSVSKLGKMFIGLAAGVLLLAFSVKTIASIDPDRLGQGLIGVTVLMAEMVIAAKALSSGDNKKMMKGAKNAILFAAAIGVLVLSVKAMGKMEQDALEQGLIGVTVLMTELVVAAKILSSGNGNKMMKGAVNALIFAAAIGVLSISVKSLSKMDSDALTKGLIATGVLIAEIVAAAKILSSGKGNKMMKGATNALIFSAALLVLVKVVKSFAEMDLQQLAIGLGGLAVLLTEVVAAANLMKGTAGATGSLLLAAVALTVLGGALHIFAKLSWDDMLKGLVGIGGALLVIGGAAAILAPVVPAMLAMAAALGLISLAAIGFGIALIAIGTGLSIFAVTGEVALYAFVEALKILIDAIPDLIAALAKSLSNSIESIAELIITIGRALIEAVRELIPDAVDTIIDILLEVIDKLVDNIQPIVEGLLDIVINILRGLVAKVPTILEEIMKLFKAIFGAIVDAMGDLNVEDILKAMAFMAALDVLMGEVAIFAVAAVAATELLPLIGRNLSSFMDNLDPFFRKINGIDPDVIAAGESVANMLLAFTAAGAVEGLTAWITGGTDLVKFGEELVLFAPYFVAYSKLIEGVNKEAVELSSIAAESVTAFANTIPKRGGLVSLITGENSLSDFALELKAFGRPFAEYAALMEGVNPHAVIISSIAAESITAFVDTIPKRGGLVGLITGENSLSDFAKELEAFGGPFQRYAKKMESISYGTVSVSSKAAETIAAFVSKLPKTGGLVQLVTGENDLGEFAKGLAAFTDPYVKFARGVGSLSESELNAVPVASAAAETIAAFASIIPPSGGIVQLVTGKNDLAAFGVALQSFGPNLAFYAKSLSETTFDKVKESGKALYDIVSVASSLPEMGGIKQWLEGEKSLSHFGQQLASFGPNFAIYANAINTIENVDSISASSAALKTIAEAASVLPTDKGIVTLWASTTSLSDFGKQLAAFGEPFAQYAASVKNVGTDDIEKSSAALKLIAEAADTLPTDSGIVELWASKTTLADFGKQLESFSGHFVAYASATGNLDSAKLEVSADAIKTLVDITNSLTNSGGFIGWITGDYDLADFGGSLEDFGISLKAYGDRVSNTNVDAINTSIETVSNIFGIFPEDYENVDKILDLGSALVTFGNNVQELGARLYAMSSDIPGFDKMFSSLIDDVKLTIDQINAIDTNKLNEFSDSIGKLGENLYVKLSLGYSSHKKDLISIAQEMASVIVDETRSKVNDMVSVGHELSNAFSNSYNVPTLIVSKLNDCVILIRKQYNRFNAAGRYLVKGFIDGMEGKYSDVEDAGWNVADKALKGINARADINSPSKEAYIAGNYVIVGFINAFNDGLMDVYSAGVDTADAALDGLSSALGEVSQGVDSEIDINPVITPIIDLSKIKVGARQIDSLLSYDQAMTISSSMFGSVNDNPEQGNQPNISFNQYNYSPKALRRVEIYRDTKNLLNSIRGRYTK